MTTASISPDLQIACADKGSGLPMVFLHGSAGERSHWYKVAAELAALNLPIRSIIPELYGYGASMAWPLERDVTIDDHVAAVAYALQRLDEPAVVVGHSIGGAIAMQLALDHPALVSHLILIEPNAFHILRTGDAKDEALLEDLAVVGRRLASGGQQNDPAVRDIATGLFVDYWNGAGVWSNLPEEVKTALSRQLSSIGSDFISLYAARVPAERYAELDVPVLVIRGGRSPQPTRRIAELITEIIPQASLIEIPEGGHMLPLSHAARLAAYIRDDLVLERI